MTVLLYAVMVTITGTFAPIGVPSALAGRVRSPRSFTPSDIGMARSLMVVVCVYCSGRGFQVLALAVLVAACGRRDRQRGGHEGPCGDGGEQHSDERA